MKADVSHYEAYVKAYENPVKEIDNIQYIEYEYEGIPVVYFVGTNEWKDMAYNMAAIGISEHQGYKYLADKFMSHYKPSKKTIFLGTSLGGAVVVSIVKNYPDKVEWAMTTGAPATIGLLNFFFRPKNLIKYRIITDPIPTSWIVWPWFRHGIKQTHLKDVPGHGIKNHYRNAYIQALKKKFNIS